jgi:hypothetical protein
MPFGASFRVPILSLRNQPCSGRVFLWHPFSTQASHGMGRWGWAQLRAGRNERAGQPAHPHLLLS